MRNVIEAMIREMSLERAVVERMIRQSRYPRGSSKLGRRLRREQQLGMAGAF